MLHKYVQQLSMSKIEKQDKKKILLLTKYSSYAHSTKFSKHNFNLSYEYEDTRVMCVCL